MKTFVSLIAAAVWALWFGGMIALFVFVSSLFRHDGAVARSAAPILFTTFDPYQLWLFAIGTVSALLLVPLSKSRLPWGMVVMFLLAGASALVLHFHYIPVMENIRHQALAADQPLSAIPRYARLHGQSMIFFTAEAVLLLISGLFIAGALAGPRKR